MPRRTKLHFNHITHYDSARPFSGLTFALRTDAHHATVALKENLLNHFNSAANPAMQESVRHSVHQAYRKWGHSILKALAADLDFERYGLTDAQNQFLDAHFYNAKALADDAVEKGAALIKQSRGRKKNAPVFYVSLDDMIDPKTEYSGEIAFSRLFTHDGTKQLGYVARPGKPTIEDQLQSVHDIAQKYHKTHGQKLQIVLLEDNVRHAKMLNWVIGLMNKQGIFKNADLGGISTCFCCAPEEERNAITFRGKIVPLTSVVDYGGAAVDVVTPRDLLFDGRVVEYGDETGPLTGRLPGPFMDVASLFKIRPDKVDAFERRVIQANIKFCAALERKFGIDLPVQWFAAAPVIAATTGCNPEDRMIDVLRHHGPRPKNP